MLCKALFAITFAVAAVAAPAAAEPPTAVQTLYPSPSVTIEKERVRLMGLLQPVLRPRVHTTAMLFSKRLRTPQPRDAKPRDPGMLGALARQAVVDSAYLGLATRTRADVDAVVLLVFLDAWHETTNDVRRVKGELEAIRAFASCKQIARCIAAIVPTPEMSQADIDRVRAQLADKRDSLSDMSQQDTLVLQQLMDQKSQLETMISNVMKAGSDAQAAVVRNLKAS